MAEAITTGSPSSAVRTCFFCRENLREDGDFMCKSCREEHPMCYECGQRKRNLPFKLCTVCYRQQRQHGHGPIQSSAPIEVDSAAIGVKGNDQMEAADLSEVMKLLQVDTGRPDDSSKILYLLSSDQNTYKEISGHFKKEWVKFTSTVKKAPEPLAIFAIQNEHLFKKYNKYGTGIRKSGRCSNSDLFFHGTTLLCDLVNTQTCCNNEDCGICGISSQGFDKRRIGSNIPRFQRFGRGIYLAPNSSKCHDYTQGNPDYNVRAQLLCLVAQGAKYELKQDNTTLTQPPEEHDSVYGRKGGSLNYDEIVVFDSDAVWPQYVVVYELNGVDKIAK